MSTYFAALSAAMAHQMTQPSPSAPAADRCEWWFDHSELLIDVADASDAQAVESRRARELACEAIAEACRIAREAVA
ncbi:hypothetical protein GCM10022267_25850 [Lentzea roselyniae]|uniref:Uncharacterized protein n=1 Tax=Lentzea roselyniae TaxID=531940 RepID=A0ABP7AQB1_9PSEU